MCRNGWKIKGLLRFSLSILKEKIIISTNFRLIDFNTFFDRNLHALTELFLHTRPVLVPADAKPPLYFPDFPVQLLRESFQLLCVRTLKRTAEDKQVMTWRKKTTRHVGVTIPSHFSRYWRYHYGCGGVFQCNDYCTPVCRGAFKGDYRTSKGLMHRSGVIHPLQDIVGLSLPWHSRLNPKYVGTGLGHKPVYTETKAKKGEGREGTQTWWGIKSDIQTQGERRWREVKHNRNNSFGAYGLRWP